MDPVHISLLIAYVVVFIVVQVIYLKKIRIDQVDYLDMLKDELKDKDVPASMIESCQKSAELACKFNPLMKFGATLFIAPLLMIIKIVYVALTSETTDFNSIDLASLGTIGLFLSLI